MNCLGGGTGRRKGLINLSAPKEISDVEPLKFGETLNNYGNPEPSQHIVERCRDLTGGA
jgi:hypothetical protein